MSIGVTVARSSRCCDRTEVCVARTRLAGPASWCAHVRRCPIHVHLSELRGLTAHQKRNLAEYEGFLDVEEATLAELCAVVSDLIADVKTLVAPDSR